MAWWSRRTRAQNGSSSEHGHDAVADDSSESGSAAEDSDTASGPTGEGQGSTDEAATAGTATPGEAAEPNGSATSDDETTDDVPTLDQFEEAQLRGLRTRLLGGLGGAHIGDPIGVINGRQPFKTRFDPGDMGFHDGLAGHPDGLEIEPAAIAVLRSEQEERARSIELSRVYTEVELDVLTEGRRAKVELAERRLLEAMCRAEAAQTGSTDIALYRSLGEANAALGLAKERAEARREENAASAGEADDAQTDDDDAAQEPSNRANGSTRPAVQPRPVKAATMPQRAAAASELSWSIHWGWFVAGTLILSGAEFPFMRAVVKQLLLEPHPPDWQVYFATVSVTIGILITTKMAGLLLRRSQSMFLLASEIHPERRPLPVRAWRWIVSRRSGEGRPVPEPTSPTEQALRFGAWGRLMGAVILSLGLLAVVLSIAFYRADAASSLANTQRAQATSDFGSDFEATSDSSAGPTQTSLVDDAFADVPPEVLQKVFLSVSLLNVLGSIVLAWASTEVNGDVVPSPTDDPVEDEDDELDPSLGWAAKSKRKRRKRRNAAKRLRRKADSTLEALVEKVEICRQELLNAQLLLVEAELLRKKQNEISVRMRDVSATQAVVDEYTYWLINRASRSLVVPPDVDVLLAKVRGTPERPEPIVDLRSQ